MLIMRRSEHAKKAYLIFIVFAFFGLVMSGRVHAVDCVLRPPYDNPMQLGLPNSITISPSDPVGTVVASASYTYAGGNFSSVVCPVGATARWYYWATPSEGTTLSVVPGMSPYTLQFGHADSGIGIRIYQNGSQLTNYGPFPNSSHAGSYFVGTSSTFNGPGLVSLPSVTYRVEIIKAAMSPANPLTSIPAEAIGVANSTYINPTTVMGASAFGLTHQYAITIVWAQPTCDISVVGAENNVVTLPTVNTSAFANSVSAGDKSFQVLANNCRNNAQTAHFSFTGTQDSSNPIIFKNSAGAPGVGVRLFTTGDGQTIGANNTTNVRNVPISGGQATLPLTAQYYKTGATVGAGQVSTKVTLQTSYN